MSKFCLSDKMIEGKCGDWTYSEWYHCQDVEEFINRARELIPLKYLEEFDELAGEKLI